jgi:hypothetical protein
MRLAPCLMRSESPTRKNEKGQSHRGRAAGVGVNVPLSWSAICSLWECGRGRRLRATSPGQLCAEGGLRVGPAFIAS